MPAAVINSRVQKLDFLPSQNEARAILADLQSSITKPDGTIKPGVLKLMHTKSLPGSDMAFERKGWWQFWARRDSKMEVTAKYLNTLFVQAYDLNEDTGSQTGEMKAIMVDFQKYLAKTNNRVGTKTLSEFVKRFEAEHQRSMVGASEMPPDTRSSRNENDGSIKINSGGTNSSGSESEPVDARHLYKPMSSGLRAERAPAKAEESNSLGSDISGERSRDNPSIMSSGLSEKRAPAKAEESNSFKSDISGERSRDNPSIMYAGSHEERAPAKAEESNSFRSDISDERSRDNSSVMSSGLREEGTRANETQARGYQYGVIDAGHVDTRGIVSSGGSEYGSPTSGIQKLKEAQDIKSLRTSPEPEALNLESAPALSTKWHKDLSEAVNRQTTRILQDPESAENADIAMKLAIDMASVAIAPAAGTDPHIKLLGAGNFGAAISFVGPDKQRQVVKILIPPVKCPDSVNASLKSKELSAAKLPEGIGVVKPSHYLIRGRYFQKVIYYKVPSERLKSFLNSLDVNRSYIMGTIMPEVKGTTPTSSTCLKEDMKAIAKQSVQTLCKLEEKGFVHHDIKPDNIIYDSQSKKMTIIDTGLMVRMSKKVSDRNYMFGLSGTPKFLHPKMARGYAHGGEVDMFSTAMTLLSIRYPSAVAATVDHRLYENEKGKINAVLDQQDWESPTGEYLANLIETTLENGKTLSPAARSELESIRAGLANPNTSDGRFLNFIKTAFDISFIESAKYHEAIPDLLKHPYLQ